MIFILNLHFCLIIYLLTNWTEAMLSCRFATTYHRLAELPPKLYQFCYLGQFATMIKSFATMMGSFATRIGGFAKQLLKNFSQLLSLLYICLFSFGKILQIQQWNDFPMGVSDYAEKTNYDLLHNICEKNYNKVYVLVFCKVLLVCYL